jgi:GLPGLI family protein
MRVNNNNGQVTSQQVNDTLHITAWFTDAIPISAGPDNYCGLPGLILALDVNNGRTVFVATEVSTKVDASDVKQPKSGKQVTQAQFDDERKKVFAEMQQNRGAFVQPPPK